MGRRQDGRIEPGQKLAKAISARAWNRAQDAADIVLGDRVGLAAEGPQSTRAPNVIQCRNDTGTLVPRFGVLEIYGLETNLETSPQFVVRGRIPTGDSRVVVAIEPIRAGGVGRVAACGVFPAQIDVCNTGHRYANGKIGDVTKMQSDVIGIAHILFAPTGTGTRLCLVSM